MESFNTSKTFELKETTMLTCNIGYPPTLGKTQRSGCMRSPSFGPQTPTDGRKAGELVSKIVGELKETTSGLKCTIRDPLTTRAKHLWVHEQPDIWDRKGQKKTRSSCLIAFVLDKNNQRIIRFAWQKYYTLYQGTEY